MALSCAMNETDNVNVTKSDAISLAPSTAATTRASISDINSLKDPAGNGFVVYATSGNAASWFTKIDGHNNHVWNDTESKWGFKSSVHWPDEANAYPMNFFAFYPQLPNTVIKTLGDIYPNISLNVVIPSDKKDQLDLLAGKKSTANKPASGTLTMTFKHILSKVNFSVSVDNTDYEAYVLALSLKNLHTTNTYDVKNAAWDPTTNGRESFEYYNHFTVNASGYTEKKFDKIAKTLFFDKASNEHLMLLPQSPTVWNTDSKDATVDEPKDDEAFVQLLYRSTYLTDKDFIGFEVADNHGGYATSQLKNDNYHGPLYVKVGYSLNLDWEEGKGYQYNIPLPGQTGGRLLDDHLYDDKGNRTDLKVPGGKVPETILGDNDEIRLDPTVTNWDDQAIEDIKD